MNFAPIILFVYNRPWHTKQTLEALMLNELADKSSLYIYCDGSKGDATEETLKNIKEVRTIIREKKWCKEVSIIERNINFGLADNIIKGVTEVINLHGNVIVLEDDIVTSPGFLKYMNDSLVFYKDHDEVMHISGYMYPHKETLPETFFFNVTLCWGWATWSSSWKYFNNDSLDLWNKLQDNNLINKLDNFGKDYLSRQLAQNILGNLKTWFIKWHASVLLKNGNTLFPRVSLVNNIGFDSSGVHNGSLRQFNHDHLASKISVKQVDVKENIEAVKIINDFYDNLFYKKGIKKGIKKRMKKGIKNIFREFFFKFFPDIKKSIEDHKELINLNKVIINKSFIGKRCKVYPKARISDSIIGDYSYIAENSIINKTIIGKFCSIGPNLVSGWGKHPTDGISTHPMFYSVKKQNGFTLCDKNKTSELLTINIGNDVFIGMNVTILDGVKIGDGAIIGAGAVVSKDIPNYAIAVGNPIRVVKNRFNDEVIKKFLGNKWWDFDEDNLPLIEKYFFSISEYFNNLK